MGKLLDLDLYSACRICLTTDKKLVDIKSISLGEDAYSFLVGKVEHNPFQAVCEQCGGLLKTYSLFRYTCHETNRFLIDMLERYELITYEMIKKYNLKAIDYNSTKIVPDRIFNYVKDVNIKNDINEKFYLDEELIIAKEDTGDAESDDFVLSDIINKKSENENPTIVANVKIQSAESLDNEFINDHKEMIVCDVNEKDEELCVKENKCLEQTEVSCTLQKGPPFKASVFKDYLDVIEMTAEMAREELLSRKKSGNYINGNFKCNLCYKGFENATTFKNHKLKHNAELNFKCGICQFGFYEQKSLAKHVLDCHKRKFNCLICPFICYSSHRARLHINMHKGTRYKCDICEETFKFPNSLVMHRRNKHITGCVCELCGDTFVTPVGLKAHKLMLHRHEENTKQGPQCSVCDLHFVTEKAYKRHLVLSSKHAVSNGCDKCGETFTSETDLSKHHRLNHARKQPRDYCTCCKVKFSTRAAYKEHMKSTHPVAHNVNQAPNNGLPSQCEICGKIFTRVWLLTYHQRKHTGEKPHKCPQCEKAFRTPSQLYLHKRVHDADTTNIYDCKLCSKKYKRMAALRKHEKIFHLGIRPYSCTCCGKSFPSQCEVRTHVKYVHEKVPWPKRNRTKRKYKASDGETME